MARVNVLLIFFCLFFRVALPCEITQNKQEATNPCVKLVSGSWLGWETQYLLFCSDATTKLDSLGREIPYPCSKINGYKIEGKLEDKSCDIIFRHLGIEYKVSSHDCDPRPENQLKQPKSYEVCKSAHVETAEGLAENTMVETPLGPRKIGHLEIGDVVRSYDFAKKEMNQSLVIDKTTSTQKTSLVKLKISDQWIVAEQDQKFYCPKSKKWKEAKCLRPGEIVSKLLTSKKTLEECVIEEVVVEPDQIHQATVALELENHPNFFVSSGILVHNKIDPYEGRQDGNQLGQTRGKGSFGLSMGISISTQRAIPNDFLYSPFHGMSFPELCSHKYFSACFKILKEREQKLAAEHKLLVEKLEQEVEVQRAKENSKKRDLKIIQARTRAPECRRKAILWQELSQELNDSTVTRKKASGNEFHVLKETLGKEQLERLKEPNFGQKLVDQIAKTIKFADFRSEENNASQLSSETFDCIFAFALASTLGLCTLAGGYGIINACSGLVFKAFLATGLATSSCHAQGGGDLISSVTEKSLQAIKDLHKTSIELSSVDFGLFDTLRENFQQANGFPSIEVMAHAPKGFISNEFLNKLPSWLSTLIVPILNYGPTIGPVVLKVALVTTLTGFFAHNYHTIIPLLAVAGQAVASKATAVFKTLCATVQDTYLGICKYFGVDHEVPCLELATHSGEVELINRKDLEADICGVKSKTNSEKTPYEKWQELHGPPEPIYLGKKERLVQFGKPSEKEYHPCRHVVNEMGLDKELVKGAVLGDFSTIVDSMELEDNYWGTITVENKELFYNAFYVSPGNYINIGRITDDPIIDSPVGVVIKKQ